jgi:malate dehydrogenase (oxaloacetate-decarboxylating)(NADP+)
MLCGTVGTYADHLRYVRTVIGSRPGVSTLAAMQMLILPDRQLFICDTHVNIDPTAEQIAEMTLLAAEEVRRFGLEPSVALLSHSNFGSSDGPSAQKMRDALEIIRAHAPDFPVDGEMQGDVALSQSVLGELFPDSDLTREANLLVMPSMDAANITYNVVRTVSGHGIAIGAILLGAAKAVHILTPAATVRRIVNMSALAVVDADGAANQAAAQRASRSSG